MLLVVRDIDAARRRPRQSGRGCQRGLPRRRRHLPPRRHRRTGAGPSTGHQSYGSFASFSDPDGNGWLLQEVTTRLPGRVTRKAQRRTTRWPISRRRCAALRPRTASTRRRSDRPTRTGRSGTRSSWWTSAACRAGNRLRPAATFQQALKTVVGQASCFLKMAATVAVLGFLASTRVRRVESTKKSPLAFLAVFFAPLGV